MNKEKFLGILRHTLTFVGGILVMKGTVSEEMATEIIGGIIGVVGAIWSLSSKK